MIVQRFDTGVRRAGIDRGWTAARIAWAAAVGLLMFFGAPGCGSHGGDSVGGSGGEAGGAGGTSGAKAKAPRYHCPMHPTIISDKPGDCPICGMRLTLIEDDRSGPSTGSGKGNIEGKAEGSAEGNTEGNAGGNTERSAESNSNGSSPPMAVGGSGAGVSGMAPVRLTAEGMKLAGLQTIPASLETVEQTIRAVGLVVADQSRIRRLQIKVSGWVEKAYIGGTGEMIRQGAPVLSIYSPELLTTQEEFLRARQAAAELSETTDPAVRRRADELVQAARQRLLFLDVPAEFVREMEKTGQAQRTVTLVSPISGYVTAKDVFSGMQAEPGMELLTVTDLTRVWVEAQLYENEARQVSLGQTARVSPAYDPALQLTGKVRLIEPTLDPETRTVKVRFEFDNPDQALKPGMFANVDLATSAVEGVFVPDDAVMDTGTRQVVFVEESPGNFVPRTVRLGLRTADKAQVLSGVTEGEAVVVRANFLLDSESKIRAAIEKSGDKGSSGEKDAPGTDGTGEKKRGDSMPGMPGM